MAESNPMKKIVQEIVHFCSCRGQPISETVAAFVLKSIMLEPENKISFSVISSKEEVRQLIELTADYLLNQQVMALETIKMQISFNTEHISRDELADRYNHWKQSVIAPMLKTIVKSRPRTREELQRLYDNIIELVLKWGLLDTRVTLSTRKETKAALESIFPQPEVGSFLELDEKIKTRQLEELHFIICGIRLYNKDCKKGGKTINNAPMSVSSEAVIMLETIENLLKTSKKNAFTATALLEQISNDSQLDEQWRRLLWNVTVNSRQEAIYLETIKKNLQPSLQVTAELNQKCQDMLANLHKTVQSRVAIPTSQVYPKFIELAQLWKRLQSELIIIEHLNQMINIIRMYTQKLRVVMKDESLKELIKMVDIKTDDDRSKTDSHSSSNLLPSGHYSRVEIFRDDPCAQFSLQGFCCWALLKKNLLLRGYPQFGVVKFRGRNYIFSSPDALVQFSVTPDWYIDQVLQKSRKDPELIHLLQLYSQLFPPVPQRGTTPKLLLEKAERGIQTELHPIAEHIDKTYEWNEWEMRNKAIKLADLQSKRTRSCQTDESHNRRDNTCQVYPLKDSQIQTHVDTGANTIQLRHYFTGLQGHKLGKPRSFQYVNLTEDIEEY